MIKVVNKKTGEEGLVGKKSWSSALSAKGRTPVVLLMTPPGKERLVQGKREEEYRRVFVDSNNPEWEVLHA
jgi:hypothetical protein